MNSKRILIVDDDPDLLFLVAHGIKNLGPDYQVSTASSGNSALEHVQKHRFDLVVTDYMMPEMTGIDLVREVRQTSPNICFILMTAHHESAQMKEKIGDLKLAAFVGKPFTMPELLKVIQQVLHQSDPDSDAKPSQTSLPKEAIKEQLQNLQRQTGAHTVLLVNSEGTPVYGVGNIDRDRASRLASFISANFLAVIEMASLFGDHDSVFKSSYFEGDHYNIYAYNINGDFFLAVVFGAGGKPGTVWFYTKQAVSGLASVLPNSGTGLSKQASTTLATDFDKLVGESDG
jgi:CheY-like chemotaxis protein/predicted regulator of Ras-like GTPase activity (Roadblock/LC7/MglB family)